METLHLNEKELVRLYNEGATTRELGGVFNCDKKTISRKLKRNGVKLRVNTHTFNHKEAVELYESGYTYQQLADKYNCKIDTVMTHIKKEGVTSRKSGRIPAKFNKDFFKEPNLLNCYWAGFIAADGCILTQPNHSVTLTISLHKKDSILIERFAKDIEYEGNIYLNRDCNNQSCISISDFEVSASHLFDNFNITPRKTHILTPPNLENESLVKAYIQGYIDGDGHIRKTKSNSLVVEVKGTLELVSWIKKWSEKWHGNTKEYKDVIEVKPSIWSYRICGDRAKKMLTSIDNSGIIRLERKWNQLCKL